MTAEQENRHDAIESEAQRLAEERLELVEWEQVQLDAIRYRSQQAYIGAARRASIDVAWLLDRLDRALARGDRGMSDARYGLRGVAINDTKGNPICCCECGCEKPRPPHWDRCRDCAEAWHVGGEGRAASVQPATPDVVEALRRALPRAVNFRMPLAAPVRDPRWDEIAAELAAALPANKPERLDVERLARALADEFDGWAKGSERYVAERVAAAYSEGESADVGE